MQTSHTLLVKYLPVWFPGANFRRFAMDGKLVIQEARIMPFDYTKNSRVCPFLFVLKEWLELLIVQAAGTATPSFVSSLLDEYEKENYTDPEIVEDIKNVAGNIYSGMLHLCCPRHIAYNFVVAGVETVSILLLTQQI